MKHTTKGTVKINTIFNTHDNFLLRLYLFFSYVIFGKITLAIANEKIVGILIKLETAPLSKPYKNTDTLFEKLIDSKLTTKMLSIKPDIGKTIFVKVIGTTSLTIHLIETSAFDKCVSLKKIHFNDKLKKIDASAFNRCKNIEFFIELFCVLGV